MVTSEDLKSIFMLGYLTDEMRNRLVPITDELNFEELDCVFREGDSADRFYMLRRGKILFEKRLSDTIKVSVGSLKPGFSFGWSSMLDVKRYTSDALCTEPCEVLSIRSDKLIHILDSYPEMGYIFMQRLVRVIKSRLDHRTEQFLRAIQNQPDIQALFESPLSPLRKSDEE